MTEEERIEATIRQYETRHPSKPEKTSFQKVLSHWMTLVTLGGGILAGLYALTANVVSTGAAVAQIPALKTELAVLKVQGKDFERLTQEAKEHRDDGEIHMSKDEKRLMAIEATRPLEMAIQDMGRALDKLTIEQRESIKRQDKIADQLERISGSK